MGVADSTVVEESVTETVPAESASTTAVTGTIDSMKKNNKVAINASIAGAGAGLVFAMVKGKNKMMFATIGAVAGYVLGNMYAKMKEK